MVAFDSAHNDWEKQQASCNSVPLPTLKRFEPISIKSKEDAFKVAIDSLFDYTEHKARLDRYYASYHETSPSARTPSHVHATLAELGRGSGTCQERSMVLIESLLYVALGQYADSTTAMVETRFIRLMIDNCLILFQSNAMEVVFCIVKGLAQAAKCADQDQQGLLLLDECITFLYVITASCYHSLELIDADLLKELAGTLIGLVANTRKTTPSSSLMKKTLLLLKITLTALLGSSEDAKCVKNEVRTLYGLEPSDHGMLLKSSPKDLYDFRDEVKEKFTLYRPPSYPFGISALCVVKATRELNNAMGVAAKPDDLLYRTQFPPKYPVDVTKRPLPTIIELKKELEKAQSSTAFATGIPSSIKEAGNLISSYMHVSLGDYQTIREREYAIAYREHRNGYGFSPDDTEDYTSEHRCLRIIDALYAHVVNELPQFIVVVLATLVATAQLPPHCTDDDVKTTRAYATALRNRDIIRSTVASTLHLMLKWLKVSHIMKYEYLSQLLVDSGYILLALRAFLTEDIKTTAYNSPDNEAYGFFGHIAAAYGGHVKASYSSSSSSSLTSLSNASEASTLGTLDVVDDVQIYTNERNMTWMLSTLRVLQMLTKGKMCRIKLMVSYKAWVPLKRIAKAYRNSKAEFYALKLIKSQVAHLGLKWRSNNMQLISAISRRCAYRLCEDWLSTTEFDEQDDAQDMLHELNLRTLIKLYNGRKYMTDLLTDLFEQQQQKDMSDVVDECVESANWDDDGWGNATVNPSSSQWANRADNSADQQWGTATPLPGGSPQTITPEVLTEAINHLYHTTSKKTLTKYDVLEDTNGWDTPARLTPIKTAADQPSTHNQSDDDDDDDDDDDNNKQKQADDPLKGIDWENLTEEEMNERMTKVEEQTEQRWLNIDINDPTYCKVLNTFEVVNDPEEDGTDDPWL